MTQQSQPTLRDLVAPPAPIKVGGITINVQPLGWYTSVEVIDAIVPALESMPPLPDQEGGALSKHEVTLWLTWLQVYRDDVVTFCHLASGQDKDAIAAIAPLVLLELLFGILDTNADFFVASLPGLVQRVGDRVASLVAKFAKAVMASTTTSSGSSSTATSTAS